LNSFCFNPIVSLLLSFTRFGFLVGNLIRVRRFSGTPASFSLTRCQQHGLIARHPVVLRMSPIVMQAVRVAAGSRARLHLTRRYPPNPDLDRFAITSFRSTRHRLRSLEAFLSNSRHAFTYPAGSHAATPPADRIER
jgi:hypothetical protein